MHTIIFGVPILVGVRLGFGFGFRSGFGSLGVGRLRIGLLRIFQKFAVEANIQILSRTIEMNAGYWTLRFVDVRIFDSRFEADVMHHESGREVRHHVSMHLREVVRNAVRVVSEEGVGREGDESTG